MQPGQSADERFDVVDRSDTVVGTRSRAVVHAEGLLHRAVHVFVFNDAGDLFLQKRSLTKDSAPGLWSSSCSGHVDSGEDYDTAAIRELEEEIGLTDPEAFEPLFKEAAGPETAMEFTWVYRCRAEGPFVLNPAEISDGKWFAPEALEAKLESTPQAFAGSFAYLWKRYRQAVDER